MGCDCLKYIMYTFNAVFWAIGATMLGVGIWLAVDPGAFDALDIASSAGMNDALWSAAVYTFIAIGAFLFLVGFLGCCGAIRSEKDSCLLWMYITIVGLIIVAEIVVVILTAIYWNSLGDKIAEAMQKDVRNNYVDETSTDAISTSWNKMQKNWECCGSYNYTDFYGSVYDQGSLLYKLPKTCCEAEDAAAKLLFCQTAVGHMYTKGCYQALVDFLNTNAPIIIGITCGFAGLQIFGILFACLLTRRSKTTTTNAYA